MADKFVHDGATLDSPAYDGAAITPHDVNEIAFITRGVYVGTAGTVVCLMQSGAVLTFVGAQAGVVYPWRVKRVNATGTTASNLVALW